LSYQVLARKYRPQRFDDVVGQQGVTQTLRNAIASGRIAHSYIFAGARGVGKTTTARILAKALNCIQGPTVEPCGTCDACVEITEGRDIDVIEIDAATHTQVDTVREVIIAGLAVRPVRDRCKIFIIDEVHQLSNSSFNALLKSIEEPPPHVVFMMATTELHKIPDTIRSRSQEFEFRTISARAIADQLRRIAEQEALTVEPAALALLARAAEGSLRDAESSLDQVMAFAGERIAAADVTAVLGLVGRDLLLDIVQTVADEDAPRVFDLAARAVEAGQDLRLFCRELSRVVRDMMLVNIDPARASDPDFAPEGDVERLVALAGRFSREDLLRAFDVIARAEVDIRASTQPRYHLEMALLKWIHLRRLQPLGEVLQALTRGTPLPGPGAARASRPADAPPVARPGGGVSSAGPAVSPSRPLRSPAATGPTDLETPSRDTLPRPAADSGAKVSAGGAPERSGVQADLSGPDPRGGSLVQEPGAPPDPGRFKEAFVEEIRQKKRLLHGTVVAQAHRLDIEEDAVVFVFGAPQRVLRKQVEENRAVLEQIARAVAGRPMTVRAVTLDAVPEVRPAAGLEPAPPEDPRGSLRERALADNAVQAMLDVFPAEIRDVEEIEDA
jgi:DNA polymerase-3 subunit gamma/tau